MITFFASYLNVLMSVESEEINDYPSFRFFPWLMELGKIFLPSFLHFLHPFPLAAYNRDVTINRMPVLEARRYVESHCLQQYGHRIRTSQRIA
jgi:hypothetical protein